MSSPLGYNKSASRLVVRQVGHELYEFRDQSGTIYIDLDDQHWMGQTPSSRDKVRIEGEIDRDMTSLEVDVKNIHVLK